MRRAALAQIGDDGAHIAHRKLDGAAAGAHQLLARQLAFDFGDEALLRVIDPLQSLIEGEIAEAAVRPLKSGDGADHRGDFVVRRREIVAPRRIVERRVVDRLIEELVADFLRPRRRELATALRGAAPRILEIARELLVVDLGAADGGDARVGVALKDVRDAPHHEGGAQRQEQDEGDPLWKPAHLLKHG